MFKIVELDYDVKFLKYFLFQSKTFAMSKDEEMVSEEENSTPKNGNSEKFGENSSPQNEIDLKFGDNSSPENGEDEKFGENSSPKNESDETFGEICSTENVKNLLIGKKSNAGVELNEIEIKTKEQARTHSIKLQTCKI